MNKVITVNLNGNALQLEESGYTALDEYLAVAEARLKDNPDFTEIMADLEQAIADKCKKYLTPNKNVVTKSEMDQILAEMGPVESSAESDAGAGTSGAEGAKEEEGAGTGRSRMGGAPKRLYRIREGAMIAGVCKGLAAYFNIDVTLVRLVFAVLTIVSGGILAAAYIVAILIIPAADTSEERAAAYGLPFNAQELVDRAKKEYEHIAKGSREWWRKSGSADWKHFKQNMKRTVRSHWSYYAPPDIDRASHVLSILVLPVFGIVVTGLTVLWILAIVSLVNTGAVFGWPLPAAIPLWAGILILIAMYSAVIGPFQVAFRGRGYYHAGRYYTWPGLLGGIVWLGCMILAFAFAYAYIPEVRDFVENLPSVLNSMVRH